MDGSRIQIERKKKGWSQEELAEKLGVSQKSISKYENGTRRPSYETLAAMSDLFCVSIEYLLNQPGSEQKKQDKGFFFFFFDEDIREAFKERLLSGMEKASLDVLSLSEITEIESEKLQEFLDGSLSPGLNELISISNALNVSIDYLLGQTEKVSRRGCELASIYDKLNLDNRDIVMGKAKELFREQQLDGSVAADTIPPEVAAK